MSIVLPFITMLLGAVIYHIVAVAREKGRRVRRIANLLTVVRLECEHNRDLLLEFPFKEVGFLHRDFAVANLRPTLPRANMCRTLFSAIDILDFVQNPTLVKISKFIDDIERFRDLWFHFQDIPNTFPYREARHDVLLKSDEFRDKIMEQSDPILEEITSEISQIQLSWADKNIDFKQLPPWLK